MASIAGNASEILGNATVGSRPAVHNRYCSGRNILYHSLSSCQFQSIDNGLPWMPHTRTKSSSPRPNTSTPSDVYETSRGPSVAATGADAFVADRHFRKREPAFAGAGRYKQREKNECSLERRKQRESRENVEPKKFTVEDFAYNERNAQCVCPAGHKLYRSGKDTLFKGYRVASFKAPILRGPELLSTAALCAP